MSAEHLLADLLTVKDTPAPIEEEPGGTPQPIWTWDKEKNLLSLQIEQRTSSM
jgi:hypothetical protein